MEDLVKTLLNLGPGGLVGAVFAVLYKLERDERKDLSATVLQLSKDGIVSQHAMADSMDKIADRIKP